MPVFKPNNVFVDSANRLAEHARQNDQILVAYSGGKDSCCVLDLVCRAGFRRVVGYFVYLIPGLSLDDETVRFATDRWGVEIARYPSPTLFNALRTGLFCNARSEYAALDLSDIKGSYDFRRLVMHDLGINFFADGYKKSDSLHRRSLMQFTADQANIIHPIGEWNRYDVMAYLKLRGITPPQPGNEGPALNWKCICWMYDNLRDDFERMARWFPYIRAVIARREFYGAEEEAAKRAAGQKSKKKPKSKQQPGAA